MEIQRDQCHSHNTKRHSPNLSLNERGHSPLASMYFIFSMALAPRYVYVVAINGLVA